MNVTPANATEHRPPVAIIVAMTRAGVIGRAGQIPWDLPEDRRLFRRLTIGHTVIMGRRTFESLPVALPGRNNIVVSGTLKHYPGTATVRNFLEGMALGSRLGEKIFIIGGSELYQQALPLADTLHISWVEGDYAGDRFFPTVEPSDWEILEETSYPGFRHAVYRRKMP